MDIDSIHDTSSPFPEAIFMSLKGFSHTINNPLRVKMMPWTDIGFKNKVRESVKFLRKTGAELIQKREVEISQGKDVPEDILTLVCRYKGMADSLSGYYSSSVNSIPLVLHDCFLCQCILFS